MSRLFCGKLVKIMLIQSVQCARTQSEVHWDVWVSLSFALRNLPLRASDKRRFSVWIGAKPPSSTQGFYVWVALWSISVYVHEFIASVYLKKNILGAQCCEIDGFPKFHAIPCDPQAHWNLMNTLRHQIDLRSESRQSIWWVGQIRQCPPKQYLLTSCSELHHFWTLDLRKALLSCTSLLW